MFETFVIQDDFFRLETEYPPKLLDLTPDGSFLLVLDSENQITLYDRDAQPPLFFRNGGKAL